MFGTAAKFRSRRLARSLDVFAPRFTFRLSLVFEFSRQRVTTTRGLFRTICHSIHLWPNAVVGSTLLMLSIARSFLPFFLSWGWCRVTHITLVNGGPICYQNGLVFMAVILRLWPLPPSVGSKLLAWYKRNIPRRCAAPIGARASDGLQFPWGKRWGHREGYWSGDQRKGLSVSIRSSARKPVRVPYSHVTVCTVAGSGG